MKLTFEIELVVSFEKGNRLGRFASFTEETDKLVVITEDGEELFFWKLETIEKALENMSFEEAYWTVVEQIKNSTGFAELKERMKELLGDKIDYIPDWDTIGATGQQITMNIEDTFQIKTNGIWTEINDLRTDDMMDGGTMDFDFFF